MTKVVVTGATGLVGSALVSALIERGDAVTVLSRDAKRAEEKLGNAPSLPRPSGRGSETPDNACTFVTADIESEGEWTRSLAGAGALVHLAGESVGGKRWDARQKQVIRDSRVESTRTIVEAIAKLPVDDRPKALVNASGADYYPFALDIDFDDDDVTEIDAPGDSFLARVCRDWEHEAIAAEALGVRVVRMRTGLVLAPGGALAKMSTPFKFFVGGRIGHGRQWLSWIHRDDAVAAYLRAIDDERYRGPINLVTDSIRNSEFVRALGKALGRPSWLPVPAFAVKAAAGEMAEYVLQGRHVVPSRLRELGFTWRHPTLAGALADATA